MEPEIREIMDWILLLTPLFCSLVVGSLIFEAARKHTNECHSEADPVIRDADSETPVPCPYLFSPAEKYMSLIVPAFNEEHRLPAFLNETLNYLNQRAFVDESFTYEVVVVDDGSTDATVKVAYGFVWTCGVDRVRVIELGKNHGKGEAVRKGMLHSRGKLLVMLDADGATKIWELQKLEQQIRRIAEMKIGSHAARDSSSQVSDCLVAVFGSRLHLERNALVTREWYHNFLMKGFHLLVRMVAGPGIRDTQCGFKMFTRAAARKLFPTVRSKGWCFDVELVYLCYLFYIPMVEISVDWSDVGGSKFSWWSIPHMLWELALMYVGYETRLWISYHIIGH